MSESNNTIKTVSIQGYPGSFHDEAAHTYWGEGRIKILPADTFADLADMVVSRKAQYAVMAIENSIAGTLLQNYRILRENNLCVMGELFLRIRHQLMVIPGARPEEIKQVVSHPMAINQCLQFLTHYPHWKRVESLDTALSARELIEAGDHQTCCIASNRAAEIYGLDIIAKNIETHEHNYTRFFIISLTKSIDYQDVDKASVYIRIPDKKGQLLQVLSLIQKCNLNMSQLQSFPVLGSPREYYFHLDIEFDHISQYESLKDMLTKNQFEFNETGVYKRGSLTDVYF